MLSQIALEQGMYTCPVSPDGLIPVQRLGSKGDAQVEHFSDKNSVPKSTTTRPSCQFDSNGVLHWKVQSVSTSWLCATSSTMKWLTSSQAVSCNTWQSISQTPNCQCKILYNSKVELSITVFISFTFISFLIFIETAILNINTGSNFWCWVYI